MNKVREIWQASRPAIAGWAQIPSALQVEALAGCGYDAIVIDMQHSLVDFAAATAMLMAIEHGGAEPLVRVQANDPADIIRLLDAGAYGIIAPMVDTAEQARTLAAAIHYPPRGARSFGPRRPTLRYGVNYPAMASETIIALAMIETQQGLENLDDILTVDGLDGVCIGPSDLALALGRPPKADSEDPAVVVRECARAAGRRVGIFCGSGSFARAKCEEGFDLVSLTPDLTILTAAARDTVKTARAGIRDNR